MQRVRTEVGARPSASQAELEVIGLTLLNNFFRWAIIGANVVGNPVDHVINVYRPGFRVSEVIVACASYGVRLGRCKVACREVCGKTLLLRRHLGSDV